MNKSTRQKVYKRADDSCELCDGISGLQIHHIIKKSQGGNDDLDNLILLCWNCHHGTKGVHGRDGHALDLRLKLNLQERLFDKGLKEKEVREKLGGRLYQRSDI
ncbi:MAG: HNH endonuclease [Halanaerobiales bacterium]|nr:HNH endonuclease [Halanaerobiales bacterium]